MALPTQYFELNLDRSAFGDDEILFLAIKSALDRIILWQAHMTQRATLGTVTPDLSQADLEIEATQTHYHPQLEIQRQHDWVNSGTNVIDGSFTIDGSYLEAGTTYIRPII